ncbi:hypothetical protein D3C71_2174570 [compost metagenome]
MVKLRFMAVRENPFTGWPSFGSSAAGSLEGAVVFSGPGVTGDVGVGSKAVGVELGTDVSSSVTFVDVPCAL